MKNPITKLRKCWNQRRNYYKCSDCGFTVPKKEAHPSGWPDHPYGLHVHCPQCKKVIAQYLDR